MFDEKNLPMIHNRPRLRLVNFSRQFMQLLLQMQHFLRQHSIDISLTAPDALVQVLNASDTLAVEALKKCRDQLLALHPHVQRFLSGMPPPHSLTCTRCGQVVLCPESTPGRLPTFPYFSCPCGILFQPVTVDQRLYPRHPVHLPGVYWCERDGQRIGETVVEELSLGGVMLQNLSDHVITPWEILLLSFTLDDSASTLISGPIRVRYVDGRTIRTQFVNESGFNHALAAYLGVRWVKEGPSLYHVQNRFTRSGAKDAESDT